MLGGVKSDNIKLADSMIPNEKVKRRSVRSRKIG
jgi:hypothetical protein